MKMDMFLTRTAGLPQIEADVEPVRAQTRFQNPYGDLEEVKKLLAFPGAQILQTQAMPSGHHHQVTIVVRKSIHDHKGG
jgi:hypothetical protein